MPKRIQVKRFAADDPTQMQHQRLHGDYENCHRIPAFEREEIVRMLKRIWRAKPKAKLSTVIH